MWPRPRVNSEFLVRHPLPDRLKSRKGLLVEGCGRLFEARPERFSFQPPFRDPVDDLLQLAGSSLQDERPLRIAGRSGSGERVQQPAGLVLVSDTAEEYERPPQLGCRPVAKATRSACWQAFNASAIAGGLAGAGRAEEADVRSLFDPGQLREAQHE